MTFLTVHNAIRGRFQSEIEDGYPVTTFYDAQDFTEPESGAWVRFTVSPGISEHVAFGGTPQFRNPGVFVAQVFDLHGNGDAAQLNIADSIVSSFRGQEFGGVRVWEVYVENVGRSGKWHQVNVSGRWYSDD